MKVFCSIYQYKYPLKIDWKFCRLHLLIQFKVNLPVDGQQIGTLDGRVEMYLYE